MPPNVIAKVADYFLSVIYPPVCELCREIQPVVYGGLSPVCDICRDSIEPADVLPDGCVAVTVYTGPARNAVLRLKYGNRPRVAAAFAYLSSFLPSFKTVMGGADFIVPVPLHANRLKTRGFNQAEAFADALSYIYAVPAADFILRIKDTPPQWGLSAEERNANVAGAFAGKDGAAGADSVRGKTIVLVDDVHTTGATLRECARILTAAGANEVRLLTMTYASFRNDIPAGE